MEVTVADRSIEQIAAECERYWRSTGVPPVTVAEMRNELETHLREANAAGKSVDDVVGQDLAAFAEDWAAEYRGPVSRTETKPVAASSRNDLIWVWLTMGLIAIAFLAVAILAPKETDVDAANWQWIWVAAAVLLGIGELLTVGFFLLPFAVGAAAAAILAFIGVSVPLQLVTFVVISVLFLVVLQRFATKERQVDLFAVGSVRYSDQRAVVLEAVNRHRATGLVRMETEQWRATTDLDTEIPVGAEVRVVEVRGTRLAVEPIEPAAD